MRMGRPRSMSLSLQAIMLAPETGLPLVVEPSVKTWRVVPGGVLLLIGEMELR